MIPSPMIELLFVDDDPIIREFAMVQLSSENLSVRTAKNGLDAFLKIRQQRPDIVLLDLGMPEVDGFEVLSHLRSLDGMDDMPVVVLTGREDGEAIDRAFETGATAFLLKPINWRLLSHQIRYVSRTSANEQKWLDKSRANAADLEAADLALDEVAQAAQVLFNQIQATAPQLLGQAKGLQQVLARAQAGASHRRATTPT